MPVEIKCLTLTQPWATLMAILAKTIETRSWSTNYRGWLGIHAAKGFPKEAVELCGVEPYHSTLWNAGIRTAKELPTGAIIAVGILHTVGRIGVANRMGDAVRVEYQELPVTGVELDFGDYTPGRYGWRFTNVWALATPIPCKGALGLWTPPEDVLAQLTTVDIMREAANAKP